MPSETKCLYVFYVTAKKCDADQPDSPSGMSTAECFSRLVNLPKSITLASIERREISEDAIKFFGVRLLGHLNEMTDHIDAASAGEIESNVRGFRVTWAGPYFFTSVDDPA